MEDNQPTMGETTDRIPDTVPDHIEEAKDRVELHVLDAVELILCQIEDNQEEMGDTTDRIPDIVADHIEEAREQIELHTLDAVKLILFHAEASHAMTGDTTAWITDEIADHPTWNNAESVPPNRIEKKVVNAVHDSLINVITGVMYGEITAHRLEKN